MPGDVEGAVLLTAESREQQQSSAAPPRPSHLLKGWVASTLKNLGFIGLWYFFSTLLSLWNRTLLGKGHGVLGKGAFPAPLLMSSLQFLAQILLAKLVLGLGLVKRRHPEQLSLTQWCWQVVPNGAATGLDIGLSNYALSLITLSFYTMCKSTTPIFLLGFCFLWGLERPSWSLALVVAVISAGLLLLVAGETAFDLEGFVLVMAASALAGLRWTITQVLLQGKDGNGHGSSGGPVEVLLALMPVMAATVALMSVLVEGLWHLPSSPYFDSLEALGVTSCLVGLGAVLAFLMVWVEFTVISETSALTFMVAGTFKEIVTVIAAVVFLGEQFSKINGVGLGVLILGVLLFNWTKYRKLLAEQRQQSREPAEELAHLQHSSLQHRGDTGGRSPNVSPRTMAATSLSAALELSSHRSIAQQERH